MNPCLFALKLTKWGHVYITVM
uniref:Uncharacterized protein n=1 Tax=Anguilla anguilla TaxID=7936 RepID=A0A0E9S958_ANGAN